MTFSLKSSPKVRGLVTLYTSTLLAGMWAMIVPTIPVLAVAFEISPGTAAQIVNGFGTWTIRRSSDRRRGARPFRRPLGVDRRPGLGLHRRGSWRKRSLGRDNSDAGLRDPRRRERLGY